MLLFLKTRSAGWTRVGAWENRKAVMTRTIRKAPAFIFLTGSRTEVIAERTLYITCSRETVGTNGLFELVGPKDRQLVARPRGRGRCDVSLLSAEGAPRFVP